jgi:alkanesulfonate monooxygenase SsuD/methylene tetrahydromethanopterin reductase-like flavin-dependent oxidoreductase (luciferase family)
MDVVTVPDVHDRRVARSGDGLMRIGIFYPSSSGLHVASRELADANPDVLQTRTHVELGQACEQVGLDFLFIPGGWAPYGPASVAARFQHPGVMSQMLAAMLAQATERIPIVTTLHTTYHHPLQIARIGATLDVLSGGRWGLNVVTGFKKVEGSLFGVQDVPHDDRYLMAAEFLEALQVLWSAEPGAPVAFDGTYYRFAGPAPGPRPVQDRPWIINAGSSPAGQEFCARHADWIFMVARDEAEVKAKMENISRLTTVHDREPDSVRVMLDANIIVRDSDEEAARVARSIREQVDVPAAREYALALMGGMEAYRSMFRDKDELETLTHLGSGAGAIRIHGSPTTVADRIIALNRDYGCKGLALSFPFTDPDEVRRFGVQVLPLLERAGVWRDPRVQGWSW